ncbi:DUF2975 domain-containing protein [Christiangramia portivictoriae]|uniref:DUF2975 domain-containing protein n=1 Tax=Christiangramia portivictoriae TaxID=326069 RepID=UPI00047E60C1|nr:DUF2975 domain-containing protein [Christiangramia portivictoriae]
MRKNNLLRVASAVFKICNFVLLFAAVALTIIFIHLQIDREFYADWYINKPVANETITLKKAYGEVEDDPAKLYVKNWNKASLYFTYFKFMGVIGITFFAVSEFLKVIHSVRVRKTFGRQNVVSFRRIGIYSIVLSFLSGVSDWDFGNHHVSSVHLDFTYLIIALLAFIFAEIFKEGNQLMEENKLTV